MNDGRHKEEPLLGDGPDSGPEDDLASQKQAPEPDKPDLEKEDRRRKRQELDDEFRAQLAIERFSEGTDVRTLAAKYHRTESVVSRAITRAIKNRLVELRKRPRRLDRIPELESDLKSRFRTLRGAMVGMIGADHQDALHEHLGHLLVDVIQDGLFRDREKILVGPGRSLFHMCERFRLFEPPLRAAEASLISVCGDSYPNHEDGRNACLDADANVNLFARSFENKVTLGLISSRLFLCNPEDRALRDGYYERYWSVETAGVRRPAAPTIALLGVGVIDANHQLALLAQGKRTDSPPITLPDDSREAILQILASGSASPFGYCAAETGMHFFPVSAPGSAWACPREALDAIEHLNRNLFAPGVAELNSVDSIVLVAGGAVKAPAVRALMSEHSAASGSPTGVRRFPVRVLCTDRSCAEALRTG